MFDHLARCSKVPRFQHQAGAERFVDEDFPPAVFFQGGGPSSEEVKDRYARLSDMYAGNPYMNIFKNGNDKASLTLENLSPHNAVNKAWRTGGNSPVAIAVRLMVSAGLEQLIKSMFASDGHEGGS